MFLEKKTLLKILLHPGLNLTILDILVDSSLIPRLQGQRERNYYSKSSKLCACNEPIET